MPQNNWWQRLLENQVARFMFSAGLGFIIDIAAFYILYHDVLTAPHYNLFSYQFNNFDLSFSISFFMGVVVNFLVNRYLVFTESTLSPTKQFFRFLAVAVVGYFANLWLLNIYIKYMHLYPPVARPAAALSLFVASFFVHKFFSFNLSMRNQHHAAAANRK